MMSNRPFSNRRVSSGFSNRLRTTSNTSPPLPNSRAVERFDQRVHIRSVRKIAREAGPKNSSVGFADARDRKPGLSRSDNRFANPLEVLGGRAFPQRVVNETDDGQRRTVDHAPAGIPKRLPQTVAHRGLMSNRLDRKSVGWGNSVD